MSGPARYEGAGAISSSLLDTGDVTLRRLRVALHPATWRADWRDWFRERRAFFGLSIGRSGTKFLARLLAGAPGATVHHEPRAEDVAGFRRAHGSPEEARRDLAGFVLPEIYLRERAGDPRTYGEVNPYLRRHAPALKALLPEARLFHLVRDGRDVVRSMYSRHTLTPEDDATDFLLRTAEGPRPGSDGARTRFDWLCWYWRAENAYLRRHIDRTVRFEDLLEDFEHFRAGLLEPLYLKVEHPAWEEAVDRPVHATDEHELPPPAAWSDRRRRRFWEICGEEMRQYGYE